MTGDPDPDPADYEAAFRAIGTPRQVLAKLRVLERMIEEWARREWLLVAIRQTASWAGIVVGGRLAFRGILADFIGGMK